ncbi:metalloregulator ArsR/SmtB family transcription factor [Olivibacter sp. CPCC 100613]|uniref:helix-turn-helix transcriptional regulator n=1 Tax=Olivibacter sp. CPCC 100613 TaxID=3079931 RepID=UPI002FF6C790
MSYHIDDYDSALWLLKKKGPQTLIEVANALKITTEGARFKLQKLANEELASSVTQVKGRGRPQQVWSLTSTGHAQFPDAHADLTVKLIHLIRQTLGEQSLETIISENEKAGIIKYREYLQGANSLEERVKKLAEIRNQEGYMAECQKQDEGYLLIENHCPICAAAQTCQGFCRSELNTFQYVLGENASVERVDHILAGARRCAYKVSPQ